MWGPFAQLPFLLRHRAIRKHFTHTFRRLPSIAVAACTGVLESGSGSEILLGLDLGGRRRANPDHSHRLARDGGIISIW